MAHKKGAGSSRNGRESESKRLGVKIYGGQAAIAGNIIIRQRGTTHHPGDNMGMGKDHTLFALCDGIVKFQKKRNNRSYVSIVPVIETVIDTKAKEVAEKPVAKVEVVAVEEAPKAKEVQEEKPKKAVAKKPAAKKEETKATAEKKPAAKKPAAKKPAAKKEDKE